MKKARKKTLTTPAAGLLTLVVGASIALALAAQPAHSMQADPQAGPQTDQAATFDDLMRARGADYESLRDRLASDESLAGKLEKIATSADWEPRLQAKIVLAWQRDAIAMRRVRDEIQAWQALPTLERQTGETFVAAPFEPFVGSEEALTLSLLEILLRGRDTFQFRIPEQLDLTFFFLGRMRAREATPLLLAIAADPAEPSRVRLSALDALASIGDPAAIDALTRLALDDPDPAIRRAAVTALGDTESEELFPLLRSIAKDDVDPRVRTEASAMIEYLEAYFDETPWPPDGGDAR